MHHKAVERCQARYGRGQRNYVRFALRDFVRLAWHRYSNGVSWLATKLRIIREAVGRYFAESLYRLPNPVSA